jgi:hypothetical protein
MLIPVNPTKGTGVKAPIRKGILLLRMPPTRGLGTIKLFENS